MTFGDLFRDIYSRLGLDGEDHSIYYDDISKAVNDSIRELRVQYIESGLGHEFTTTETLSTFTQDSDYPFVNSDTLSNKIMEDLPIQFTVLSSTCYNTANEITDSSQSFDAGDVARREGKLYECVETFASVNTYDLFFNPKDVRNYYRANGLVYEIGDIVRDSESGSYYEVNTGFTNNQDTDADSVTELDKLYWKEIGTSYLYVSHYPFKSIHVLRVFDSIDFSEAFSINEDTVYATPNIDSLTLSYIAKWTDVQDLTATLDLPDYMIPAVKDRSLVRLGQKLGVEIQQLQEEQEDG